MCPADLAAFFLWAPALCGYGIAGVAIYESMAQISWTGHVLLKLAIAAFLKWPEAIEEWAVQTHKVVRMSGEEYAAAMVAVIRKFDRRKMIWMHDQISQKRQHALLGPVVLMQALGMLIKDSDNAPEVLHLGRGHEGTGQKVYGLLAHHKDTWTQLVMLADRTPTITAPQAKEEIEGFINNMGHFLCAFPSSFGMGNMNHQSTTDPTKAYKRKHVLRKLVLLAPHWAEVHGFSASTSILRASDTKEPPSTTQTPAASQTSLPWWRWRLTGTIWENITMESMRAICPDREKLCEAIAGSTTAAQVEHRFGMHALMLTCWACCLHGVPQAGRATFDKASTSGLRRLWHKMRDQGQGGVEPSIYTLFVALRQADGGGVKRKSPGG
jgi:hypothetical protein